MTKADNNKREQTKDNNNKQTTKKKMSYQVLPSFLMTDQQGLKEKEKSTTLYATVSMDIYVYRTWKEYWKKKSMNKVKYL